MKAWIDGCVGVLATGAALVIAIALALACGAKEQTASCSGPCGSGYVYCAGADIWVKDRSLCPSMGGAGSVPPGGGSGLGGSDRPAAEMDAQSPSPSDAELVLSVDGSLPFAPSPNRIRCGSTTCDALHEYCCQSPGNGAGGGGPFESCAATCGFRRECDEAADCVAGEVCCMSVFSSPPPSIGSYCTKSGMCGGDQQWIACSSQEECAAVGAPPCVAQVCLGSTLQTCGPIGRSSCR